jgi:uncharacterized delta-60 repeat protein
MKTVFTLSVIFLFLNVHAQSVNKAGTLDSSFGVNGVVTTDFNNGVDEAYAVALLPNKKILAAGIATINHQNFSLAQYKADGSLDKSFGKDGKVHSYFGKIFTYTYCVAVQADGKILLGGSMSSDKGNYGDYFLLIRYNKNGSLDSSFANNGIDTIIISNTFNTGGAFRSILLQPDGKIIGAGSSSGTNYNYTVMRFMPTGKPDSSFGINGITRTIFGNDFAVGACLQPDGKIIVGGNGSAEFLFMRYNTDGSLDKGFGNKGIVSANFGSGNIRSTCRAIALQSDGKIVAAGEIQNYREAIEGIILTRFNADGTTDYSFGNRGGYSLNKFNYTVLCKAMALQPNGKIVLAGSTLSNQFSFGVARYNNDGSVDTSFGPNGGVQNSFYRYSEANAVAIQPDGKIIAVGEIPGTNCNICTDFGLIRYNGDEINKAQSKTSKSLIQISPNPATNILRIQGLPSNQKIKITVVDFVGNTALSVQLSAFSTSYNLNIASLKPGNYLLKIETNDEVVTKQFVKE